MAGITAGGILHPCKLWIVLQHLQGSSLPSVVYSCKQTLCIQPAT